MPVCFGFTGWSQVPNYSVVLTPTNFVITCNTSSVGLGAVSLPGSAPLTVTVTGQSFNSAGTQVAMYAPGSYTMAVPGPTAVSYVPFTVPADTVAPIVSLTPTVIIATSSVFPNFTCSAVSPLSATTIYIYSPLTGTHITYGQNIVMPPATIGEYTFCIKYDHNGCITCKTAEVLISSVGLEEEDLAVEIQVFPNPNSGILKLKGLMQRNGVLITYEVLNAVGEKVWHEESRFEKQVLNLEGLPNGLYFLRIRREGGPPETVRFMIEH